MIFCCLKRLEEKRLAEERPHSGNDLLESLIDVDLTFLAAPDDAQARRRDQSGGGGLATRAVAE